jgi:hypothetical protein
MPVTTGNSIQAADYNGLQSRIAAVLGTGSGDFGYGQTVTSSQVTSSTDSITAAQMDLLRADMNSCWLHQNGENIPVRNISVGDVIGADVSGDTITYDTLGNYTVTDGGTNPLTNPSDTTGGLNDYFDAMTDIENNRFTIDAAYEDLDDLLTEERTTSWNSTINMTFTVTFASADARRHFFNAGGEIRIRGNLAAGGGAKDTDWRAMIANPGTICFGYNYTSITGSTTGVSLNSIGNYDLTATYQTIFTKTGNAAVYAENDWNVRVKQNSTTVIEFSITFNDDDTGDRPVPSPPPPYGPLVDEQVTADLTMTLGTRRASTTDSNSFSIPNPAFAVTNALE